MDFGNFTVNQLSNETRIDYQKNSKDWFDLSLALILGLAACSFVVLIYIHTHFNSAVFWIVGGCFAFFGLIKLADGFSRLTAPSQSVVLIAKDKKMLSARTTIWKTMHIDFDDISAIVLKGKNIATKVRYSIRYQVYVTIQIKTKDGRYLPLLNINPPRILTTDVKTLEAGEYTIGKGLAQLVATETGKLCQWTGFEHTTA